MRTTPGASLLTRLRLFSDDNDDGTFFLLRVMPGTHPCAGLRGHAKPHYDDDDALRTAILAAWYRHILHRSIPSSGLSNKNGKIYHSIRGTNPNSMAREF